MIASQGRKTAAIEARWGRPLIPVFIHGDVNYTPRQLEEARFAVREIWWARMSHNHYVLCGDGYGIDAELIRECKRLDVPYQCHGITVQPRNGNAGGSYYRFLPPPAAQTKPARYAALGQYLAGLAQIVICLGSSPDVRAVYEYAKWFNSKRVTIKQFEQPLYNFSMS